MVNGVDFCEHVHAVFKGGVENIQMRCPEHSRDLTQDDAEELSGYLEEHIFRLRSLQEILDKYAAEDWGRAVEARG